MIKKEPYEKEGAKTKKKENKDNMEGKKGKRAIDCGVHTKHILRYIGLCITQYIYGT